MDELLRAVPPLRVRSALDPLLIRINTYLVRWARRKYKDRSYKRAKAWWDRITTAYPNAFAHWTWQRNYLLAG